MTKHRLELLKNKYRRDGYKMALREMYNEYEGDARYSDPAAYDVYKDDHLDDFESSKGNDGFAEWKRANDMAKANEVRSCKDANGKIIKKGDMVEAIVNGKRVYGPVYRIIAKNGYGSMKSGRYLVDINNKYGRDAIVSNLEVSKADHPIYNMWRDRR